MTRTPLAPPGAFQKFRDKAWPGKYRVTLQLTNLVGGIPTDPHVGDAYIRSKLEGPEDQIQELVAQTMSERGVTAEEAAKIVGDLRHLNGFKRDSQGLYIEGRQVKAMIREAASVAYATGKLLNNGKNAWGRTAKGIHGFIAEHVCVAEDRIHLGTTEPDLVLQNFVHTWRGSGIQYQECVTDATITFTVMTDYEFTEEQWAMLWLTAEQQGLGASRSQGYGRFTITGWEKL